MTDFEVVSRFNSLKHITMRNENTNFCSNANYKNASSLFQQYKDDPETCAVIADQIVDTNFKEIDNPYKLIETFTETTFYKRHAVSKPTDIANLGTLEPAHLILSVDNPVLYGKLYNLYQFQTNKNPLSRCQLIKEAASDLNITKKQIENCVLENYSQGNHLLLQEFQKTFYYKVFRKKIEKQTEILPIHLIINSEHLAEQLMLTSLCIAGQPLLKNEQLTKQGMFLIERTLLDRLNLELELFTNLSNQDLVRYLPLLDDAKDLTLLCRYDISDIAVSKALVEIEQRMNGLLPAPAKQSYENNISFIIPYHWTTEQYEGSVQECVNRHNSNSCSRIYTFGTDIGSNFSEIWKYLTACNNSLSSSVLPYCCKLFLPEQTKNWSKSEEENFIQDLKNCLGISSVNSVAFTYEVFNIKAISLYISGSIMVDHTPRPVSFATAAARMPMIIHELEEKYKDFDNNWFSPLKSRYTQGNLLT